MIFLIKEPILNYFLIEFSPNLDKKMSSFKSSRTNFKSIKLSNNLKIIKIYLLEKLLNCSKNTTKMLWLKMMLQDTIVIKDLNFLKNLNLKATNTFQKILFAYQVIQSIKTLILENLQQVLKSKSVLMMILL